MANAIRTLTVALDDNERDIILTALRKLAVIARTDAANALTNRDPAASAYEKEFADIVALRDKIRAAMEVK